jgi:hypothetical protein
MKLDLLNEGDADVGAALKERAVRAIFQGESQLKRVMVQQQLSMDHVITAIVNNKCLFNLGPTYLEQTLSGVLRDIVPVKSLNQARKIFGLEPLSSKELHRQQVRKTKRK